MIFLYGFEMISPQKWRVPGVHLKPFDEVDGLHKTAEELEQTGILVESVPEPNVSEGQSASLFINPETKDMWYEYEVIPKTPEQLQAEEIENLKSQQAAMSADLQAFMDYYFAANLM